MDEQQQANQSSGSAQRNDADPESPLAPVQQPNQDFPQMPGQSGHEEFPTVEMRQPEFPTEQRPSEPADNVAFVLGHAPVPQTPNFASAGPQAAGGTMPETGAPIPGQGPFGPPAQAPLGAPPYAMVSGPPPGVQQPAYAYPQPGPVGTPPPIKNKKKTGLLVGLTAVLAILAVVAVVVVIPWLRNTAERAVTNYLQALASGNADAALSYARETPKDLTFLTNEQLQKSNELAAMTAITVEAAETRQPTSVTAHYKMGEEEVTAVFGVTKVDDVWKVNQVTQVVRFDAKWATSGLTIRLNEQAITGSTAQLFPGTYQVSTGNRYITVGDATVHVKDPTSPANTTLTAALTDEGSSAVIQAATARWQSCLAEKNMWPEGCGFVGSSPVYTIKESSVKWSQTSAPTPIEDATVTLSETNPMEAVGSFNARAHLYVEFSSVSGHGWIDWDVKSFTADLSKDTVTVVFDRGERVNS